MALANGIKRCHSGQHTAFVIVRPHLAGQVVADLRVSTLKEVVSAAGSVDVGKDDFALMPE